jgi:hypothetical protein
MPDKLITSEPVVKGARGTPDAFFRAVTSPIREGRMQKPAILLAAALLAGAGPGAASLHPRMGELCELDFVHDSTALPLDSAAKLDAVAGWAAEHPTGLIVLDTHPDAATADARARAIERAAMTRAALMQGTVDTDRVVIALYSPGAHPGSVVVWGTDDTGLAVAEFTSANGGVVVTP